MQRWGVSALVIVAVAVALALAAGRQRTDTATADQDPPPPAGKTLGGVPAAQSDALRVVYTDDPDTLNVLTSGDSVSGEFQSLVYEPLASRSFQDPDKLEPRLAESWEFNEEKLEYTIHLRKGVKWHPMHLPDGTLLPAAEFAARDVIFTFACVVNPHVEAESWRTSFEDPQAADALERNLIDVEQVDDYTVKVRWRKPYFLSEEATLMLPIIPRHVYSVDSTGDLISLDFSSEEFADGFNNHWANTSMCGTGPLIFDSWHRTERVVLVRNPEYWGQPFYFSRVVFHCETNENTLVQKLLQRGIDWADIAQTDLYEQARHDPRVEQGKVKLEEYIYPSYRYVGYNLRRPFLDEVKVRRALTHAVPIHLIIDKVFRGLARPTTGHFQPGSPAFDDTIEPLQYDLQRARELLDEAGWVDSDRNGIRDKKIDGRRVEAHFELLLNSDILDFITLAEIMQAHLNRIGVAMKITPLTFEVMLQKQRARNFDAVLGGWNLTWRSDPYDVWDSSQADIPGSSNIVGYQNQQVDKWIDQLHATYDHDKQIELYHKIQRQIYEDQPCTFLFVEMQTGGINGRLRNVQFYKTPPCIDMRQWYAAEDEKP